LGHCMAVCTPGTHSCDCNHKQGFFLHQLFSKLHWCNSVGPLHGCLHPRNSQVRLQSQARLFSAPTLFKAALVQQCWATAWLFAPQKLTGETAVTGKAFLCTNSFQSCTGATVLGHCMAVCTPGTHSLDCSHRQGFSLHQLFSKLHWCNSVGTLHGFIHHRNSQVRLQSQARLFSAPTLFKAALVQQCWATAWLFAPQKLTGETAFTSKAFFCNNSAKLHWCNSVGPLHGCLHPRNSQGGLQSQARLFSAPTLFKAALVQ